MFQHLVNDTVFLGLLGRQERVHFDVLADLLDVTTGICLLYTSPSPRD